MRILTLAIVWILLPSSSQAGIIISIGARWDAAPRVISGNERSLDGGIRYAVEGNTLQAYRDRFSWVATPSVGDFQQAVGQAFGAWKNVDPVSGFGTKLNFLPDSLTPIGRIAGYGTLNLNGAEIDLLASDAGSSVLMGQTAISLFGTPVTLTSGVSNYDSSVSIQGVDIHMNNNPQAFYTLDSFRRLLTHEIGHAIGLGDVDMPGDFIDDNFNAANAAATLNNSWAHLVNPLDPANSIGLSTYSIPSSTFGLPGIDLLMESNGVGVGPGNPLGNLFPLTNDEYGMRQYLYPSLTAIPEPGSAILFAFACSAFLFRIRILGRLRRSQSDASRAQNR